MIEKEEGSKGTAIMETGVTTESYAESVLNPTDTSPLKVLGVSWNTERDMLMMRLDTKVNNTQVNMTKRSLLRAVPSIFDLLGILSPVVLKMKLLFQGVCKKGVDWDEALNDKDQDDWKKWIKSAKEFTAIEVPRLYSITPSSKVKLVGFCDASKAAYSAVVFIICKSEPGESIVSIVTSKIRVAPLKEQTIPRLELLDAVILARLIEKTKSEISKTLNIERIICLTDSEVTLNWIQRKNKQYKQFVQNCVVGIRKRTEIGWWYHVAGTENAADLPSRGCLPGKLERDVRRLWLEGLDWLKGDQA